MSASSHHHPLPYRPDIDGLRAVAVIAVLLFHYRIAPVWGGFAGVDVFFVISGFLITSIIHRDMKSGAFSIAAFYERRVRRIVPALFAMVLVIFAPAALILLPADFRRFAQSAGALMVFMSNMEFWRELGYFDVNGQAKPLLHTWSVSIEEQYYLLVPVLLMALRPLDRYRARLALGILFIASLAFSVWCARYAVSVGFYLLPSRFWEIALGALLALTPMPDMPDGFRSLLGIAGLSMLVTSFVVFSSLQPFPGYAALLPCVGTALVIFSGTQAQGPAYRILALPGMIWVGRISYSLYLWHWPLWVLLVYLIGHLPTPPERLVLILASFMLGYLSWRFIELPFRRKQILATRRELLRSTITVGSVIAAAAVLVFLAQGVPQRFKPQVRTIAMYEGELERIKNPCFSRSEADVEAGRLCVLGDARVKPSFVLWGDSHASAISGVVGRVAARQHVSGYNATFAGCPPVVATGFESEIASCSGLNKSVLQRALRSDIRTVILTEYWPAHMTGTSFPQPIKEFVRRDPARQGALEGVRKATFAHNLETTVGALSRAGKRVVIILDVPEAGWQVPERLAMARQWGLREPNAPSLQAYLLRQKDIFALALRMRDKYGAKLLFPHTVLCASGTCKLDRAGIPFYYDDNHLSEMGAQELAPLFTALFSP